MKKTIEELNNELIKIYPLSPLEENDPEGKIKALQNRKDIIIKNHKAKCSVYSDGRWKTYVKNPKNPAKRILIAAKTKDELNMKIIWNYIELQKGKQEPDITLAELFPEFIEWRGGRNLQDKTVGMNRQDWDKFVASSFLAEKKIIDITADDLDDFIIQVLSINNNMDAHKHVTEKAFGNLKSLLNLMFKYAGRKKIIAVNPMSFINPNDYKLNYFPVDEYKPIYTKDDIRKIMDYLSNKEDPYSLSIQLAFNLCVRISELIALRPEDYDGENLHICRSRKRIYKIDEQGKCIGIDYKTVNCTKSNHNKGFHYIPLTDQAITIIEKTMKLYPDNEYLFMKNGKPIYADSFNRH